MERLCEAGVEELLANIEGQYKNAKVQKWVLYQGRRSLTTIYILRIGFRSAGDEQ